MLSASDGAEALEIFRCRLKIDLLLTDIHLETGMSRIELATTHHRREAGNKSARDVGTPKPRDRGGGKGFAVFAKTVHPSHLD
jgi:CheY-like chemotaxis protein